MRKKLSIAPRLGRMRKKDDSSPDEEAMPVSAAGRRASLSLRRIGKSLAASLDSGEDYMEDDPIGAFLELQAADSDPEQPRTTEEPGLIDILASPPENAAQGTAAPGQPAQSPGQGPADPQPGSFAPLPAEFDLPSAAAPPPAPAQSQQQSLASPPPAGDLAAQPPASQAEALAQSQDEHMGITAVAASEPVSLDLDAPSTAAATPPAQSQQQSPAGPPPAGDPAAQPLASQAEAPAQDQDERMGITAVAASEPVSLDLDAPSTAAATPPPTEGSPQSPAEPLPTADIAPSASFDTTGGDASAPPVFEEPPMTLVADAKTMSFDLDEPEDSESEDPLSEEVSESGGKSGDSLLDIFASEDIEENPIADLAKGLPKIDMNTLVEKVNQLARDLKGEPLEEPSDEPSEE